MTFVDTNYFIRFLIRDVESQYVRVRELFDKGLKGEEALFSSGIVFFELFWVFTSFYKKDKKEVVGILRKVLSLAFIDFENREVLQKSLDLFDSSNLELEDCYNVMVSKDRKCEDFATFDRKLKKHLI